MRSVGSHEMKKSENKFGYDWKIHYLCNERKR